MSKKRNVSIPQKLWDGTDKLCTRLSDKDLSVFNSNLIRFSIDYLSTINYDEAIEEILHFNRDKEKMGTQKRYLLVCDTIRNEKIKSFQEEIKKKGLEISINILVSFSIWQLLLFADKNFDEFVEIFKESEEMKG